MTVDQAGTISGYTFGAAETARSPLSLDELGRLKQTVLLTAEDEAYLRMAGDVLAPQADAILDLWYGFVGSHPHLVYYFNGPEGQPSSEYLAAVRQRFGQWILDTCYRPYDQAWLDYQYEIGLRHHRTKKGQTDRVSTVPIIGLRYMIAFIYPITATIKGFLTHGGHSAEDVEKMHQAWFKSVVLHVALWSQPYVPASDF